MWQTLSDFLFSEATYVACVTVALIALAVWTIKARDRYYEKNGRDWRDDQW